MHSYKLRDEVVIFYVVISGKSLYMFLALQILKRAVIKNVYNYLPSVICIDSELTCRKYRWIILKEVFLAV